MTDQNVQFTQEEIEKMRTFVLQHDSNMGKIRDFDLNNPPKMPYRHQEYPKMLYDHQGREYILVKDREQEQDALAAGYRKEPFPAEVVEVPLSAEDSREAEAIDRQLKKSRRQQ